LTLIAAWTSLENSPTNLHHSSYVPLTSPF